MNIDYETIVVCSLINSKVRVSRSLYKYSLNVTSSRVLLIYGCHPAGVFSLFKAFRTKICDFKPLQTTIDTICCYISVCDPCGDLFSRYHVALDALCHPCRTKLLVQYIRKIGFQLSNYGSFWLKLWCLLMLVAPCVIYTKKQRRSAPLFAISPWSSDWTLLAFHV